MVGLALSPPPPTLRPARSLTCHPSLVSPMFPTHFRSYPLLGITRDLTAATWRCPLLASPCSSQAGIAAHYLGGGYYPIGGPQQISKGALPSTESEAPPLPQIEQTIAQHDQIEHHPQLHSTTIPNYTPPPSPTTLHHHPQLHSTTTPNYTPPPFPTILHHHP